MKSGVRGADVLQKVMSDSGQLCGTILWESKRVRNWSDKWIDKLIEDKQAAKADVAVIVTDALPEHVQHMGGVRGVLLTTFSLAACLAETLRVNMALLGQTRLALSGQDDQKSRIFQYFTSPQFHERMATIAEQFQQMQADLAQGKSGDEPHLGETRKANRNDCFEHSEIHRRTTGAVRSFPAATPSVRPTRLMTDH